MTTQETQNSTKHPEVRNMKKKIVRTLYDQWY